MNQKNTHKRILLNKNASGQIDYCEACDVIEITLGPVSVRLHAKDLALFSDLVSDAEMRLSYYEAQKADSRISVLKVDELH